MPLVVATELSKVWRLPQHLAHQMRPPAPPMAVHSRAMVAAGRPARRRGSAADWRARSVLAVQTDGDECHVVIRSVVHRRSRRASQSWTRGNRPSSVRGRMQSIEAGVQVGVASFDESVGIEQDGRAAVEDGDGLGAVGLWVDAEEPLRGLAREHGHRGPALPRSPSGGSTTHLSRRASISRGEPLKKRRHGRPDRP